MFSSRLNSISYALHFIRREKTASLALVLIYSLFTWLLYFFWRFALPFGGNERTMSGGIMEAVYRLGITMLLTGLISVLVIHYLKLQRKVQTMGILQSLGADRLQLLRLHFHETILLYLCGSTILFPLWQFALGGIEGPLKTGAPAASLPVAWQSWLVALAAGLVITLCIQLPLVWRFSARDPWVIIRRGR